MNMSSADAKNGRQTTEIAGDSNSGKGFQLPGIEKNRFSLPVIPGMKKDNSKSPHKSSPSSRAATSTYFKQPWVPSGRHGVQNRIFHRNFIALSSKMPVQISNSILQNKKDY